MVRNFEELLAGTFLVLMTLTTVLNVFARYFFNAPVQWAEEFARYAFIWLVFTGAALCTKYDRHIVIDSVVGLLPARPRAVFLLLANLVTLGLMLAIAYYGWVLSSKATQPTSTLHVPQYVVYIAMPLSALLVIYHSLQHVLRNFRAMLARGDGG